MFWLALALFGSVVVLVLRAEKVALEVMERMQTVQVRRLELEEKLKSTPPRKEPLPPDLESIAERETEPWAREQVRAAIQDDYEAHGDWDEVRKLYFSGSE